MSYNQPFGSYFLFEQLNHHPKLGIFFVMKFNQEKLIEGDPTRILVMKRWPIVKDTQNEALLSFNARVKSIFSLQHSNVMQLHDCGHTDGHPYIVMENSHGKNIKQLKDALLLSQFDFPAEIALFVFSKISEALHFLHTFDDPLNPENCNLTHGNLSQESIILTYDGSIKLTNLITMDEGIEYGQKSPADEQRELGRIFWEVMTGKSAPSGGELPPAKSINPSIDEKISNLISKMTSQEDQFPQILDCSREMNKILHPSFPDFSATDMTYFIKEIFKSDYKKDIQNFITYGNVNLTPYFEDYEPTKIVEATELTSTNVASTQEMMQEMTSIQEKSLGIRGRVKPKTLREKEDISELGDLSLDRGKVKKRNRKKRG